MDENQTPGTEAEVPATAPVVETAPAAVEVPNVSAPAAVVSEQPVTAAPAVGVEAEVVAAVEEVPSILKSELAHVFEAFEHFSLMEGISRLYALAKKHL